MRTATRPGMRFFASSRGSFASTTREHDEVARYGGEEFAILSPMTDAAAGSVLAERLRTAIAELPMAAPTRYRQPRSGHPGQSRHARGPQPYWNKPTSPSTIRRILGRNCVSHHDDLMPMGLQYPAPGR